MSKGSTPPATPVTSKRFYDAYSRGYSSYLERHAGYFRAVERVLAEAAGDREGLALLDVGTGTGERLQRIVTDIRPARVVAIDESPEMAALARKNCPSAEVLAIPLAAPQLPAALSSTSDETKSDGAKFDLVTCLSNVLGHVPRTQLMTGLKQVRTLLKPGGSFVFDVNNRYNAVSYGRLRVIRNLARDRVLPGGGDFTTAYRNGDEVLRTSVHLFSPSEVAGLLRESGLTMTFLGFRDYTTGRERGRFGGSIVAKAVSA
ncbi:class I SAM-dependent methyltransferase [Streptomyces sp. NPDC051217]|uniref:class I SAM-dependent methyltransferase n=1 Tax=Streptomyces sp. NPDC051217 TaxID=3365644 RepID=UPI00378A7222